MKQSALASVGTFWLPSFLTACSRQLSQAESRQRKLIVIQLSGGNDGLNTVVPFRSDVYYKKRPKIALPREKTLKMSSEWGFHPAMKGLAKLYENGQVGIVNQVGYPNPDRSHFRSMDIWQTGSGAGQTLSTGWLGRYLDSDCAGCGSPLHAIQMNGQTSLALRGHRRNGMAMTKPGIFKNEKPTASPATSGATDGNPHLDFLQKTYAKTFTSAQAIYEKSKIYAAKGSFPKTSLGRDLKTVAELILSGLETQVYYVSLGGFDTHEGQLYRHEQTLTAYSEAVAALVAELQSEGAMDEVLIMTFSEFGRRVAQNKSNGTDHGMASNLYFIGNHLRQPGMYNPLTDLSNLQDGDVPFDVDFRRAYATALGWLGADSQRLLGEFEALRIA